jgi:hypothetical protein
MVPVGSGVTIVAKDGTKLQVLPGENGSLSLAFEVPVVKLARRRNDALAAKRAPGRPPSAAILSLRSRLIRDLATGNLRPKSEYVTWFQEISLCSQSVARQAVRRELIRQDSAGTLLRPSLGGITAESA